MDDLPTTYDAIVVGTGFVEAVIAAALSRIGKTVLHLDNNDYYGENWASFNLDNIDQWIGCNSQSNNDVKSAGKINLCLIKSGERVIDITRCQTVINVKKNSYVKKTNDENQSKSEISLSNVGDPKDQDKKNCIGFSKEETFTEGKLARKFNLDLCPKLLYSRGPMVELLISSNVAKYAEFKSLNKVLTWRNEKVEPVPCSRADVFATKNVSVVEKRMLVKILTLFTNYTSSLPEFDDFKDKTFLDFLEYKKLPENLIHYVLYAIAMGDDKTSCLNGVKSCKVFLDSLGRYGNTPFIFPLYGSGELPQCFCRLSAVFGGIYCLNRGVQSLIVEGDKCTGLISNGIRLNADKIIMSSSYFLQNYSALLDSDIISRAILITDRSLLNNDKDTLTLLQFPPVPQISNQPVTVLELGSATFTCPDNFWLVHLTSKGTGCETVDLKHAIESLFDTEKSEKVKEEIRDRPRILWSLTWNSTGGSHLKADRILKNLKICNGPDAEVDYNRAILQAKEIFQELYPDEEFLPRAPDPDDIVLDLEDQSPKNFDVEEKQTQDFYEESSPDSNSEQKNPDRE